MNKVTTNTINTIKKLVAKDGSINYIIKHNNSFIECRYVRRTPFVISTYLSSHNGCKMGCKFCWLTQQKQTNFSHVGLEEYNNQLKTVLNDVTDIKRDQIRINANFMARGESLANKTVVNNYSKLYDTLRKTTLDFGFNDIKMNLSTIMPNTIKNKKLIDIFGDRPVNIYYSLYSTDNTFKTNWMPNAMHWQMSLDKIKEFQDNMHSNLNNTIVFHGAFIKGQNDSDEQVQKMAETIKKYNFRNTKFNLVRLNPPIGSNLEESHGGVLKKHFSVMTSVMNHNSLNKKSTVITRAGPDVWASCGMFPRDEDI